MTEAVVWLQYQLIIRSSKDAVLLVPALEYLDIMDLCMSPFHLEA